MIIAVTAFVPIPGHPRPEEEYHKLAAPLRSLAYDIPVLSATESLENCWLYQYLNHAGLSEVTHSTADNPTKNTLAYHIVQAQKTEFLMSAATACALDPDVYVWIDYGIFHVPGMTEQIIKDFLDRAEHEQAIAIPGCWGEGYTYDDEQPCWRFCGGVMVVPRKYLQAFNEAMKREYLYWLRRHNHVSWEVNMLAQVEVKHPELPIWWYQADDHDASMFTNYKATEFADANRHQFRPREAHPGC